MSESTAIVITWVNHNVIELGLNVYKSTVPFDTDSLPPVYRVLPRKSDRFSDTEVVNGTSYYYMISTYTPTHEKFGGLIYTEASDGVSYYTTQDTVVSFNKDGTTNWKSETPETQTNIIASTSHTINTVVYER